VNYRINEIFYSLQGEGVRVGSASVFVRFSGCNKKCPYCDTEFDSARELSGEDIFDEAQRCSGEFESPCVIFTGGEPALQLDKELVERFQASGWFCAIETNGTIDIEPLGLDWICVSPKVAEHRVRQLSADEVRYVRHRGQGLPVPRIKADHFFLSPAFGADGHPVPGAIQTCVELSKEFPQWRVSLQQHKLLGIR
jgi:7-carboxy-7-deazaguanine synthase